MITTDTEHCHIFPKSLKELKEQINSIEELRDMHLTKIVTSYNKEGETGVSFIFKYTRELTPQEEEDYIKVIEAGYESERRMAQRQYDAAKLLKTKYNLVD